MFAIGPGNAEEPSVPAPAAATDSANDLAPTGLRSRNPPRASCRCTSRGSRCSTPAHAAVLADPGAGSADRRRAVARPEDHLIPRVQHRLTGSCEIRDHRRGGRDRGRQRGSEARCDTPSAAAWMAARRSGRDVPPLSPRGRRAGSTLAGRELRLRLAAGEAFFGIGPDAAEADAADFAMQAERAGLRLSAAHRDPMAARVRSVGGRATERAAFGTGVQSPERRRRSFRATDRVGPSMSRRSTGSPARARALTPGPGTRTGPA